MLLPCCYHDDETRVVCCLQFRCTDELQSVKPVDEGLQLQLDSQLLTQVFRCDCKLVILIALAAAAAVGCRPETWLHAKWNYFWIVGGLLTDTVSDTTVDLCLSLY